MNPMIYISLILTILFSIITLFCRHKEYEGTTFFFGFCTVLSLVGVFTY